MAREIEMPKSMFDKVKDRNGERFAKAIRNYDNGIFDIPNIDQIVKYAGSDAEPIMAYLVSLKNIQIEEMSVHRNPIELLAQAGYDAWVADTLEKQNAIKKYFEPDEELCTFEDPNRFKNYYIINAVRKDVDKIKRAEKPAREDEYGTSVISIQILKTGGFISIKNRYNHKVVNPDNTFYSNPDNIIMGLSDAIKHFFNVDFSARHVNLPDGYVILNGYICKYNQEIENTYFGTDFYIQGGAIYELDNGKELMLGNGNILYFDSKRILNVLYRQVGELADLDYIGPLNSVWENKKIGRKNLPDGTVRVFADYTPVFDVKNGMITGINVQNIKKLNLEHMCLQGVLDFTGVEEVCLYGADLSNVDEIIFGNTTEGVDLMKATGLHGDLDFSGVTEYLNLSGTNLANVSQLKINPECKKVSFDDTVGLKGELKFKNNDFIVFKQADLRNVTNIEFTGNVHYVDLSHIEHMPANLDCPGVNRLILNTSDLFGVKKLKLNPNAELIDLDYTSGLRGEFDLSNVGDLRLMSANLTLVTGIKFNPNGKTFGLSKGDKNQLESGWAFNQLIDTRNININATKDDVCKM